MTAASFTLGLTLLFGLGSVAYSESHAPTKTDPLQNGVNFMKPIDRTPSATPLQDTPSNVTEESPAVPALMDFAPPGPHGTGESEPSQENNAESFLGGGDSDSAERSGPVSTTVSTTINNVGAGEAGPLSPTPTYVADEPDTRNQEKNVPANGTEAAFGASNDAGN